MLLLFVWFFCVCVNIRKRKPGRETLKDLSPGPALVLLFVNTYFCFLTQSGNIWSVFWLVSLLFSLSPALSLARTFQAFFAISVRHEAVKYLAGG